MKQSVRIILPLLVVMLAIAPLVTSGGSLVLRSGDAGDVWKPVPWIHPNWGNPIGDPLAQWTWPTPQVADPSGGEVHTYERDFDIDSTPTSGSLTITCDNGYQVFLNDQEIGIDGLEQADSPWDTPEKRHALGYAWQSAETYDLTDKLRQRSNTLKIIVVNYADPRFSSNEQNPAGLLYRLDLGWSGEMLYPVADGEVYAYSYRNWNWANAGMYEVMGAGWHPTGGEKRAYLRFDIPVRPDISGAVLKLYQYHSAGPVHSLGVYRVTSPWDEGNDTYHSGEVEETAAPGELCWMQQPSFDPVPVVNFTSATAVPAWVEVDVTSLVQQWQSGTPNYGLVIKTTNEHPNASDPEAKSGFCTKEHPDQEKRPVLELSYTQQSQQLKISDLRGTLNTDNDCNLYVADWGDNQVKMIDPDGSASSYVSGIDRPRYQVFDPSGNLYIGSFDGNIYKVSASGKKTVVAGGIWSPQGMDFDSSGNIYVAGGYDGKIYRIAPDGAETFMDSGFTNPKHLVITNDGNVYVVGSNGTFVLRITPEGERAKLVDLGETIMGMATDGNSLYVSHLDKISKIDAFGQITHVAAGLDQPSSLTVCKGNIFVTVRDGIVKTVLF